MSDCFFWIDASDRLFAKVSCDELTYLRDRSRPPNQKNLAISLVLPDLVSRSDKTNLVDIPFLDVGLCEHSIHGLECL
jgi:hypothetical protein